MARLCTIYALSDPRLERVFENVRYVGKTWKPLRDRLGGHLCRRNTAHKSQWIRSLEADGFIPAIWPLAFCSIDNWQDVEKFWIAKLRPVSQLTNVLSGGGSEINWTEEIRRKLSESAKRRKRYEFSEIHRARIRKAAIGRKASPEARANISAALMGKKRSPEICAKFRLAQLNRGPRQKHTEQTKAKMSAAHLRLCKKNSESTRAKISQAKSHPIMCVETGERFASASEAAKHVGVVRVSINRAAITGVTCKGFNWVKIPKTSQCHAQP